MTRVFYLKKTTDKQESVKSLKSSFKNKFPLISLSLLERHLSFIKVC